MNLYVVELILINLKEYNISMFIYIYILKAAMFYNDSQYDFFFIKWGVFIKLV